MLTSEEKHEIVNYISGWSVKAVMEDCYIEEENWDEVDEFLELCRKKLKETMSNV